MPHPGKGIKQYDDLSKEDKEAIRAKYYDGLSYKDISQEIGCSQRGVRRVLISDFGINTRRKNRYVLDESFFEEINSEEKAYSLGFMMADGFVDARTGYIVIQVAECDKD